MYSESSIIRTPLGSPLTVLFMEVSFYQRIYMHTCQCEECQMGQNSGVLLKEVAAIISEVSFNRGFPVCTLQMM